MALFIIVIIICSIHSSLSDTRIAGGSNADIKDFPYQVSLQTIIKGNLRHFCGGSILNKEWILTAGHCIKLINEAMRNALVVVAGSTKLSEASEEGQTVRNMGEYYVHPNYDGGVGPNDIAVFKVEPLSFSESVKAVTLPPDDAHYTGKATGSGWGSTRYFLNLIASNTPDNLQEATYDIMNIDDCRAAFGTDGDLVDKEANICTEKQKGLFNFPSSMCNGDSGGPLSKDGMVIGIVSWGHRVCGFYPSVFTRVAHYVNRFIKVHVPNV